MELIFVLGLENKLIYIRKDFRWSLRIMMSKGIVNGQIDYGVGWYQIYLIRNFEKIE